MIVSSENSTKLQSLSLSQLQNLSLEELIGRMDSVRFAAWRDRYSHIPEFLRNTSIPYRSLTEFMITKRAQEMKEADRRRLAYFVFQYLFQSDLITTTWGISNKIVFENPYDEYRWSFPRQWFMHSALEQYQIISSRVLLEKFFYIIYFVYEGKMVPGGSKFEVMRKWLIKPDNPFQCFIPDLINAYKYDRIHRNREIHGASRFVKSTLRLEVPTQLDRAVPYPLARIVHKLYDALLEIMDFKALVTESLVKLSFSEEEEVFNQFKDKDELFVRDLTEFAINNGLQPLPEMIVKKKSEMSDEEKQKMNNIHLISRFVELAQKINKPS